MEHVLTNLLADNPLCHLLGNEAQFRRVIESLPGLAKGRAAVLVQGETGTGKELVARAVHYLSPRAAFPFIPLNCGSLSESLIEPELFGHERGAFTDAHAGRKGLIAQADRGTLFLDEVDTLPTRAQVALLRFLQEGAYRPVGSSVELTSDARVIAASNAPLPERVRSGALRADLYYRLAVLQIVLPPLRERPGDIVPLARHFFLKHGEAGQIPPEFSGAAQAAMLAHSWPGNVRELENAIIRALHVRHSGIVEVGDLLLPERKPPASTFKESKDEAVNGFERSYLTDLLARYRGNVSEAARAAGKERRDLGKLIKKHQLNPRTFRAAAS